MVIILEDQTNSTVLPDHGGFFSKIIENDEHDLMSSKFFVS